MTAMNCAARFPAVFVNHGGGPLPLLGKQPGLVQHMKEVRTKWLPEEKPSAIVIFSAHWDTNPVKITSSAKPSMLFDYYGFPDSAYAYKYPAPGHPDLAKRIQSLLTTDGIPAQLDSQRGYDHGVFIPLMLMYPEADIPVVCVSLHSSLSPTTNMKIGQALASLRNEKVLFVGSGYTFHNMHAFRSPNDTIFKASTEFNEWLKTTITGTNRLEELKQWDSVAPSARFCHPREEHLMPLFVIAALGSAEDEAKIIYDDDNDLMTKGIAVSSYMFP